MWPGVRRGSDYVTAATATVTAAATAAATATTAAADPPARDLGDTLSPHTPQLLPLLLLLLLPLTLPPLLPQQLSLARRPTPLPLLLLHCCIRWHDEKVDAWSKGRVQVSVSRYILVQAPLLLLLLLPWWREQG